RSGGIVMNVGFIGYGEVGHEMSEGLSNYEVDNIYAFDPLHADSGPLDLSEKTTLTFFSTAKELAVQNLDILFVAVPANKASEVWKSISGTIKNDTIYVDLTTASAQEKNSIDEQLENKGSHLIDASILVALKLYHNDVPILIIRKNICLFNHSKYSRKKLY